MSTFFAIAIATAAATLGTVHKIEVQGHRGARSVRPENTLPAFDYALETGVDTLELDLGVTRDGVLVVSHDPLINAEICLGPDGARVEGRIPLHSLSLEELKRYDCGTLKNPRFPEQTPVPGTRIPTLEEVFALVKQSKAPGAKTVQFNIETKIVPRYAGIVTPEPEQFAKLVVDAVKKAGLQKRVVVQSFDHRSLLAVRKLDKSLRISPLFEGNLIDLAPFVKGLKPEIISPNMNWISPEIVRAAQKAGARVIPWTANTPEDWEWLVRCGVDGIITDDPAKLIAWLKEKGLRGDQGAK